MELGFNFPRHLRGWEQARPRRTPEEGTGKPAECQRQRPRSGAQLSADSHPAPIGGFECKSKTNERGRDGIFFFFGLSVPFPKVEEPAGTGPVLELRCTRSGSSVPAAWSSLSLAHALWTQLPLLGLRCSRALCTHPLLPKYFSKVPK